MYLPPWLSGMWYYWTNYRLELPHLADGDNAKLEVYTKDPYGEGGINAYDSSLVLDGETGYASASFMDGWWAQYYANVVIDGQWINYLAPLVQDLQQYHKLAIETKNNIYSVYYDDTLVYSRPYSQAIGKIKAIHLSFK